MDEEPCEHARGAGYVTMLDLIQLTVICPLGFVGSLSFLDALFTETQHHSFQTK